jgi:heterodisulfide reductase subunit C
MPNFNVSLAPARLDQTINPWSWSLGSLSLFSINLGQSADPPLEQRILDQVGSYGRQIGQIGDALAVILAHVDLGALSPSEQAAIDRLKTQLEHVKVLKDERRQEPANASAA